VAARIGRKDGTYLKNIDPFMRFFPFIMKKRNESAVYFKQQIEVTELRNWLSTVNRNSHLENKTNPDNPEGRQSASTFFHAIIAALTQTFDEKPQLNRFICGQRVYQRNHLSAAFVMKRSFSDDSQEEIVIMKLDPKDGMLAISRRIREQVRKIRSDAKQDDQQRNGILNWFNTLMNIPRPILRGIVSFLTWVDYHGWLPSFILELDPMHCTMFISNLSSLKIDAPYHHLYEWGTTSVFITIGTPVKVPVVVENDQIEVREVINLAFTVDERICDGFYFVQSFKRMKYLLENPEELKL
jgi:hypothetical protein